jgi:nitrate/TMAO reductase-like tetraheme cytochrome c subunit
VVERMPASSDQTRPSSENQDESRGPSAAEEAASRVKTASRLSLLLPTEFANPLTILGAAVAGLCMVLIVALTAVETMSDRSNPYLPLITFMLLPGVMVMAMALAPVNVLLRRRMARRAPAPGSEQQPTLVLDLKDSRHLRLLALAAAGGVVAVALLTTATVKGYEFGESAAFCGLTCHSVMQPEYVAYQSSPHARVQCVQCHIGPGPDFFVKAKVNGMNQLVSLAMGTYPRPIPVPVENLRPSRDTCEQCHWPDRTYRDRLHVSKQYASDDRNTERDQTIVFRVGGGESASGVHWHVANEVWYVPMDRERQQIASVEVRRPDGTTQRYVNPAAKDVHASVDAANAKRRMDCVDCHNRAGHDFRPFESEVDRALASGRLDPTLPQLKRLAVALGPSESAGASEDPARVRERIGGLADRYQKELPRVYAARGAQIQSAASVLTDIYDNTVFPQMAVDGKTYQSNLGHVGDGGCARCHGTLVSDAGDGRGKQTISNRCDLCHYAPVNTLAAPPSSGKVDRADQSGGTTGRDISVVSRPGSQSSYDAGKDAGETGK